MTPADWLIVVAVLLSLVMAAIQGFFAEILSMAGLVVGYIVAAWQYQRLAEWLMSFLKNEWLAEIFGFLPDFETLFVCGVEAQLTCFAYAQFDSIVACLFGG